MQPEKERSNWWYLVPIFLGLIGGIIAYFALRNDDLFVNGLSGCFCVWIVYPRTNVQPPTKISVFDNITLLVNDMIYRWG